MGGTLIGHFCEIIKIHDNAEVFGKNDTGEMKTIL